MEVSGGKSACSTQAESQIGPGVRNSKLSKPSIVESKLKDKDCTSTAENRSNLESLESSVWKSARPSAAPPFELAGASAEKDDESETISEVGLLVEKKTGRDSEEESGDDMFSAGPSVLPVKEKRASIR